MRTSRAVVVVAGLVGACAAGTSPWDGTYTPSGDQYANCPNGRDAIAKLGGVVTIEAVDDDEISISTGSCSLTWITAEATATLSLTLAEGIHGALGGSRARSAA